MSLSTHADRRPPQESVLPSTLLEAAFHEVCCICQAGPRAWGSSVLASHLNIETLGITVVCYCVQVYVGPRLGFSDFIHWAIPQPIKGFLYVRVYLLIYLLCFCGVFYFVFRLGLLQPRLALNLLCCQG